MSSSHPVTTGGTTSGRWTIASSSNLPGNRPRARAHASAKATGSIAATATPPTRRLSPTIPHSSTDSISGAGTRNGGRSLCLAR